MEESEEILIKSLINLGIEIPPHITSIKELDSSSFFSISSQSLHLLLHNTNTSSFPTSLPDSMPEKVNSCSHLASLLHHLSYPFQISFHQFLYPSEEDLYKLIRFLVERLSESSEARKTVKFVGDVRPSDAQLNSTGPLVSLDNQKVSARLHDMRSEGEAPGLSSDSAKVPPVNFVYEKLDVEATTGRVDEQETVAYIGGLNKKAAQVEETAAITEIRKPEQESISYEEFSPEPRCEVESICGQETVFPKKATGKDLEVHYLEEELELLKEAVKMALDDESSFSSIAEQLSEQIATRNENLQEAKKQW